MKDWKTVTQKFLYPPVWLTVLLVILSAAVLITIFIGGWEMSPIAYAAYVLAFYSLSVACIACAKVVPEYYRNIKKAVYDNQFGNRYLTDAAFRTHISLYLSLGINLLYVGMNILSGVLYRSSWFGILAGYYTILAVMRFLLVRFVNRNGIGKDQILEFRRSRLCCIILMTINLTLSGAVLMMLYQNKGYDYHGILIYVMAMYTFYITTHSIIDIVKYRKYNSSVMSTSKIISLSAALVSMLSLETAMFSQFGADTSPQTRWIMIAATGAGVSVIVVSMSVYMIIHATKTIKKLQSNVPSGRHLKGAKHDG